MVADTNVAGQVVQIGGHLLGHWQDVLVGSLALSALGHAVNTCPTPQNVWLQWLLGIVKYVVGQRISAANAIAGLQTETTAVTAEQKAALAAGSVMEVVKTDGVLKPLSADPKPDSK